MNPLTLAICATLALAAPGLAQDRNDADDRIEIPGELAVSFVTDERPGDVAALVEGWDLDSVAPDLRIENVRTLLQWQRRNQDVFTTVVLLEFDPATAETPALQGALAKIDGVDWSSPNRGMLEDPRELDPNDPQYPAQYHHPLMRNNDAWNITLGSASVIMGITDDGVDLDHADLAQNIWVNVGEIPGDGIDNDMNGYVDDVNGYDFVFDNNDPNPNGGNDHGTHCAGIAGARTDNMTGVAGTAGHSTIMPIQFYASGQPWTAANIAESFAYGVDNGCNILSTSYNINGWVGDPVVTAAFDYLYDMGVLHFNSAGNGSELNPARQAFHQSFLVISTTSTDQKSGFSNYGTGCDICAPGSSILATILNDNYGTKSGTSMASPNAAGVAALIWSANPTWTRAQVAAQLIGTGDNIDAQNPGLQGLLGGGRVNSFRALTETLPPPQLVLATGLPADGSALVGDLEAFTLRFDHLLDPVAANSPGAFALEYAGPDGTFGTPDDQTLPLAMDEYLLSSNELSFQPGGALPFAGNYRVIADASVVTNPFGTALDGNGDGVPGDDWTRNFSACATVVAIEDNAESGVDWSVVNQNLTTGAWTVPPEVPIGGGAREDPPTDYDGSGRCFLTENAPGNTDVDGGPTRLISRAYDIATLSDPYVSFAVWLGTTGTDVIEFHMSDDDGASWTLVDTIQGTDGWEVVNHRVLDHVALSANTRLRWSLEDVAPGSVTEGGIDFIRFFTIDCDPGDLGTAYCTASANSTGSPATVSAAGSAVAADNDVTLTASSLPAGVLGYFINSQTQGFVANAGGSAGNLCVVGDIGRYNGSVLDSGAGGTYSLVLDLTQTPQPMGLVSVLAGETWNFQSWYRDQVVGIATSNFTDGVSILFQ